MENNKKKLTKAMKFADIRATLQGTTAPNGTTLDEMVELLDKEITALANKNKRPNKKKKADAVADIKHTNAIMDLLMSLPEDSKGLTCSEILRQADGLFEDMLSTQKVAYLLSEKYGLIGEGYATSDKVRGEVRYRATEKGYGYIPIIPDEANEDSDD